MVKWSFKQYIRCGESADHQIVLEPLYDVCVLCSIVSMLSALTGCSSANMSVSFNSSTGSLDPADTCRIRELQWNEWEDSCVLCLLDISAAFLSHTVPLSFHQPSALITHFYFFFLVLWKTDPWLKKQKYDLNCEFGETVAPLVDTNYHFCRLVSVVIWNLLPHSGGQQWSIKLESDEERVLC